MYFPYLRGRMYEAIAVRRSEFLLEKRILPIFEPISVDLGRFQRIVRKGIKFALILNSANGDPDPPDQDEVTDEVFAKLNADTPDLVLPAFEIRATDSLGNVRNFASTFKLYQCLIVHRNHNFSGKQLGAALRPLAVPAVHVVLDPGVSLRVVQSIPTIALVAVKDVFHRCRNNSLYPPDSNFGDLLHTYDGLGFDGFGDFSIVGDMFRPGGGAPERIAIHLPEEGPNSLILNHFVTDARAAAFGTMQDRFLNVVDKLAAHTGYPPRPKFNTEGVRLYLDRYHNRTFPNFGPLKQWSIMHHMEIVDRALKARGVRGFL